MQQLLPISVGFWQFLSRQWATIQIRRADSPPCATSGMEPNQRIFDYLKQKTFHSLASGNKDEEALGHNAPHNEK